jgi:hypothetical protein
VKPGRIPCLNPRCQRTAPIEKYPRGTEIVCGKCWKLLPKTLRGNYKILRGYRRRIERITARRRAQGTVDPQTVAAIATRMEARKS